MTTYAETATWQRTLGPKSGPWEEGAAARNRLAVCFEVFRERAGILAGEIALSCPSLTVHGLPHLDALWGMVDVLAGSSYPINPVEAFVLGGAFLTHDLGNGLAVFPGGEREVLLSTEGRDAIGLLLRRRTGQAPTKSDLETPPPEIKREALEATLRARHARQAPQILKRSFKTAMGEMWLIDDTDVRGHYGGIIGEIAESHSWGVQDIARTLGDRYLGPPPWMPSAWVVDVAKLACLLRVADAAHLDSSRAPCLLRALRTPDGTANLHWEFQARLARPIVVENKLLYSTGLPFGLAEADSWWLAFDALRLVDRELHDVNDYLAEKSASQYPRGPLQIQGVAGIESPKHLSKHVATNGWQPVDARLMISDVTNLIRTLGGTALYGDDPVIPLRELLQNAADAVRARRVLEKRDPTWGEIVVRQGHDSDGVWLEVADTGVGMSEKVLLGSLLDFGKSLWSDDFLLLEHPGLAGSHFRPSGRFGIGFFSVFMWGDRVEVVTRRYDEEAAQGRVLVFRRGLSQRPLLRPASPEERPVDGGTRIRVWLRDESVFDGLLDPGKKSKTDWLGVFGKREREMSLSARCAWVAPALDVGISVSQGDQPLIRAVAANDWITMEPMKLVARIQGREKLSAEWTPVADAVEVLRDEQGNPVARIAAGVTEGLSSSGILVENGIYVSDAPDVTGIVTGSCATADRRSGCCSLSMPMLRSWAERQARRFASAPSKIQTRVASILNYFGADISNLRCFEYEDEAVSLRDLRSLLCEQEQFTVTDRAVPEDYWDEYPKPHILFKERLGYRILLGEQAMTLGERVKTIGEAIAEAAADIWGCSVADVVDGSELDTRAECPDEYARNLDLEVHVVRRPVRRDT